MSDAHLHVIQVGKVAVMTNRFEYYHCAHQNQPHGHFQFLPRLLSPASLEDHYQMIPIHLQSRIYDLVILEGWQDSNNQVIAVVTVAETRYWMVLDLDFGLVVNFQEI